MQTISRGSGRLIKAALGATCLLAALGLSNEVTYSLAQSKRSTASIPRGTQMRIRLENTIDSKESRNGDRFTATVLTPNRYADATIEGHVAHIKQSGKFKGQTAISLVFDRIRFRNGGSAPLSAQVVKVYGEDSVKEVDEEGEVKGGSRGKTTATRTAGGAALGAVIGGIAGGGKGAAIGAAVGAGVGAGSVFIQGSNRVKLEAGTEVLIRTTR